MKKSITALAFILHSMAILAQQDAQYTQNMFNHLAVNPGYAGIKQALCGTVLHRQQWIGFPGAPVTSLISIDKNVSVFGDGGIGITLASDKLGNEYNFIGKFAYSFHQILGPGILGLGVEIGMIQKGLKGQWIYIDPNDPLIPDQAVSFTTYDIGLGAFYKFPGGTYLGISSLHLPQSSFRKNTVQYKNIRHYYLSTGTYINLPNNRDFQLNPSLFVKTDAASTQIDINALMIFQRRLWGGFTYRLTDAVALLAGCQMGSLKLGYAFDLTTSKLKDHSQNTHEIMLGYCHVFPPRKEGSHSNTRNMW